MCILETERTLTMLWPAWPRQAVPPIPKPSGIVRLSQMHIAIYEQRLYITRMLNCCHYSFLLSINGVPVAELPNF